MPNDPLILEAYNKHYVLLDNSGNIIDAWSDGLYPTKDTSQAICINEQGGYQFRFDSLGEENPLLYNKEGLPLYKYEDGAVISRTEGELKIAKAIQRNLNLSQEQETRIAQSKQQLANYLATHPLTYQEKEYSVTQEKQSLLTSQLALYMLDNSTALSWNASGEPCATWEFQDLAALSKAIAEYVHPLVVYQQEKEVEIKNATTGDELDEIVVDYDEARNGNFLGNSG